MDPIRTSFDQRFLLLLDETASHNTNTEEFANSAKNLAVFAKIRNDLPEPDPIPDPVPETRLGRFLAATGRVLDNETTRTFIKAGGAFAGVATVVYASIYKDHVMERQAMSQANQRNS